MALQYSPQSTMNREPMVEIPIEEYERNRYLHRCHVYDVYPDRAIFKISADEYYESVKRERMENPNYMSPMYYYGTANMSGDYEVTTSNHNPRYRQPQSPEPKAKESSKVSKQIRHQFLRGRLLERLNK